MLAVALQLGFELPAGVAPFVEAFVVGVLTPLTAACALPLYPGFLSYLARSDRGGSGTSGDASSVAANPTASDGGASRSSLGLGLAVVAGVVAFMGAVGLVFAYFLQESLTTVVEIVSPAAFAVLLVLGVALALDHDAVDRLPGLDPPETGNAYGSAFVYGLFFGGIVLPCNPGFIALFFARTPILFDSPIAGFAGFLVFGLGMGAPLLAFAAVSEARGRAVTRALARNAGLVNRITGVVMVAVAAYYLVVVFDVAGIGSLLGL
ncbi:sulfite exporter TauE/SafE family protein [Halorubellus litoreus]|uniref:Sulfite exporter TauE/SafE family protein n=1 Tax=Halorubellus litoreus TaxID=755308 RepID=A0ABD5VMY5_9EURY